MPILQAFHDSKINWIIFISILYWTTTNFIFSLVDILSNFILNANWILNDPDSMYNLIDFTFVFRISNSFEYRRFREQG